MTYWSWLDLYSITSGKRGVSYSLRPRAITSRHVQTRLMLRTHTHTHTRIHVHIRIYTRNVRRVYLRARTHVRRFARTHMRRRQRKLGDWPSCAGIGSPYGQPPPSFVFLRILTIVRIAKFGQNDSEWPEERDFPGNYSLLCPQKTANIGNRRFEGKCSVKMRLTAAYFMHFKCSR